MSSLTAGSITNNSVTLSYVVDNSSRAFSVFMSLFLVEGTPSFSTIEAAYPTGLTTTRGISPFETLSGSQTITGLSPNTTYSFMYSVTRPDPRTAGFDPADVIFRRPLSPPGTFTTLGPPIFTDSTISSPGTVGVFYADGVTASSVVSYSLASGSLPPGISLSTGTGSITGTPTTAGTYSFTVSANNGFGSTTLPLSLTINPAAPVWIDQTISSPALKDSPYSDGVFASNSATYSVSAGSLPTGISLNSSTGAITGTPTVVQTSNFTIQASNVTGTITTGLTLQIIEGLAPPVFTDAVLSTDLRRGIAYSDAVAATDATNYATSGTFVPGLTLNATTGAVAGTPTAQGTYSFNIIASNASGSATAPFTLPVKPGARRWDGSAWVRADRIQRWDGSAFVNVGFVKRWDGSAWVNADD
jgi:hypothetical protein